MNSAKSRPTWSPRAGMVRAGPGGAAGATGDHLVVLDVGRHYSPESLTQVIAAGAHRRI